MFHSYCACLLLIVLSPQIGWGGDDPRLSPEPIDPSELADQELMQKIREQVESLPPEEQRQKGQKILLDSVENFKSESIRRRVYHSIGRIYQDMGDIDNAAIYLQKAGEVEDGTGVGAISREYFLDVLEGKGDFESLRNRALEYRDSADGSDQDFASLTQRAGMAMIQLGNCEQAVELGIDAATRRPCQATFHMLETFSDLHTQRPRKMRELA